MILIHVYLFNPSDVSVSITRVNLLVDDVSVQVTVLDDGLPVTEPKIITLTLLQRNPSGSDDIFVDTAELTISTPQGKNTILHHVSSDAWPSANIMGSYTNNNYCNSCEIVLQKARSPYQLWH